MKNTGTAGANVHANYSSDWCTPPQWWRWVRDTLGTVDLDPCADANHRGLANGAYTGIDGGKNGLAQDWLGRVYCNPPGSNSNKSVKTWWTKGMDELEAGRTTDLVFALFNMETAFSLDPSPLELPGWLIMPSRRISFYRDGALPIDPNTGRKTAPRNRTWFYSTCRPATPPIMSWIVETGDPNVQELRAAN